MDEFDLFAAHPRQTLLYNLFDIAQSRKAPIAVLGLSARVDVADSLEKRVKSRFSHRYVYISLAKKLASFTEMCKKALQLQVEELDFDERAVLVDVSDNLPGNTEGQDLLQSWNASIETLLASPVIQHHLSTVYYTTKSLPTALTLFHLPLTTLTPTHPHLTPTSMPPPTTFQPPDSKLSLLLHLPTLSLALLIAATRLDIILDTDTCNFNMAYDEYCALGAKARVSASASSGAAAGVLGIGGRVAGRALARAAWEKLVELDLLIPISGAGAGASGLTGIGAAGGAGGVGVVGTGDMVRCDVKLEEIEPSVPGLEKGLVKWCREI